jgi:hypothetical protein
MSIPCRPRTPIAGLSTSYPPDFKKYFKNPNLTVENQNQNAIFPRLRRLADLPFTVTEVQSTPNPNATKFVLDHAISDHPVSFFNPESGKEHPIAARLFAIPGVAGILLLGDFVTVNKKPEARWGDITPKVKKVLTAI